MSLLNIRNSNYNTTPICLYGLGNNKYFFKRPMIYFVIYIITLRYIFYSIYKMRMMLIGSGQDITYSIINLFNNMTTHQRKINIFHMILTKWTVAGDIHTNMS